MLSAHDVSSAAGPLLQTWLTQASVIFTGRNIEARRALDEALRASSTTGNVCARLANAVAVDATGATRVVQARTARTAPVAIVLQRHGCVTRAVGTRISVTAVATVAVGASVTPKAALRHRGPLDAGESAAHSCDGTATAASTRSAMPGRGLGSANRAICSRLHFAQRSVFYVGAALGSRLGTWPSRRSALRASGPSSRCRPVGHRRSNPS